MHPVTLAVHNVAPVPTIRRLRVFRPSSARQLAANVANVRERDSVIVARIAAGDDDAIGEAFELYAALVFGVARRAAGNTCIAEDVVQEVFAALWQNPLRFDSNRGSLRAYLGVQAHRRAVDAVRGDTRRRAREERSDSANPPTDSYHHDGMDPAALTHVVREAIARLPDDQRQAVELAFWQGRTHREVATILGIPPGTAKSRLRLAQAKLSEWLAPLALETA